MALEPDAILDVRREICTFREVRILKKVKEMKSEQILAILTDYAQSLERIPRFLEKKNHKILAIEKTGTCEWRILVKI